MARRAGSGAASSFVCQVTMHRESKEVPIMVDRLIDDRTGLSGAFDFTLEWAPDPVTAVVVPSQAPATLPRSLPSVPLSNAVNFLAALEQQLGLVIVPELAAEPALIVDEIQLPFLD
jgi:uncharacterized protein (TIGR03435 family)